MINLFHRKVERVTADLFFGQEHQYGRQVLRDELKKAHCDPEKIEGILDFVSSMLVAQTEDVLSDVKRLDIV